MLFGNLAPERRRRQRGRRRRRDAAPLRPAQVFESETDAVEAIAAGPITSGAVVVIRNCGPKGAAGMPECYATSASWRPGSAKRRSHHRRPLQRRHARRRHRPRGARGPGRRPHRSRRRWRHDRHRHPRSQPDARGAGGGDRAAQGGKPPYTPRDGVTGYLARYVKLVSGAEKGAVLSDESPT